MKLAPQIQELKKQLHATMREMYASGNYSHEQVAEAVGHSHYAARWFYGKYKDEYDFPYPQPCLKRRKKIKLLLEIEEKLKEAHAYYLETRSLRLTGEKYGGISYQGVADIFRRNNLKILPSGGRRGSKRFYASRKGRGLSSSVRRLLA